jgi:short-subunit dehydrogenase
LPNALITGASSGLGEHFAYALAREGFELALTARREQRLKAVGNRAKALGAGAVRVIPADLARRETPGAIKQQLDDDGVEIDYLVNNAGFGTTGCFERLPLERELEEIDLNVTALVALTRLFVPPMVARRKGTIINVASTAAFQPLPYMATYAATKAFVVSFSQALSAELAGTGVGVSALCPGPVRTEFQQVAGNQQAHVPSFVWMDAATVVANAVAGARSGRSLYIAGALNFVMAQAASRLAPRSLVTRVVRRMYRPAADKDE